MLNFIFFPLKIARIFTSHTSLNEVGFGVCLGMLIGFVPINGPMAWFLAILLLVFKVNQAAAILVFPLFKLLYLVGIAKAADIIGGYLLIDCTCLTSFWASFTRLPIIAYLDFNNTLVAGGIAASLLLSAPIFFGSRVGVSKLRQKYFEKVNKIKLAKGADKFAAGTIKMEMKVKRLSLLYRIIKFVLGIKD